ncbi:MAG TPA: bifunctional UDP-N-acetylglucosamine diphosphorylase/glucosamine-1-phosphate N-acetyltransferase GlmU [Gammaproteobacteria bacterium]|nr:bifunctional UDP-N-acetylglucosamine diphosphorylase/glucosamine-1-phosphate N-acetyltransferase GlmU [Gammaproteobacteria bacterium]
MSLSVVILAAGKGKRMMSTLPKVMHPVGGKAMLHHVVDLAMHLSAEQVIVVHGEDKEPLRHALSNPSILWALQKNQLGTGDAVSQAMPFIPSKNYVLILYGDVPLLTGASLTRLLQGTPINAMGLITAHVDNPFGLGRIIRNNENQVLGIREEKDANDQERQIHEINTGIFLLPAHYLEKWLPRLQNKNAQQEFYLTDIVEQAVAEGVKIFTTHPVHVEEVLGINDKIQLAQAERCLQKRHADHFLKAGVRIFDPARFDVRGALHTGSDVSVDIGVIFEGEVSLGNNTHIGPYCILKNCQLEENVTILAHCHLEGVKIKKGAVIGPFARIRPGTEIGESAKVGNFVEIKNTIVGNESKISHLSYIGDATIGTSVNIGAGTITCNYDGTHKHQTYIEDYAFIGSGTQLVAPVKVESGAMVGAGSTLTKDAPRHQLTLTHKLEHRTRPWQKPPNKLQALQDLEEN